MPSKPGNPGRIYWPQRICLSGAPFPTEAWLKSKDGQDWQSAPQHVFMKKEIRLDDGTVWKPERLERPFVLTDDQGEPMMLFIALLDQGRTGNIAIPLSRVNPKKVN